MSDQNEARKNQIAYMQNVLGVSSILQPAGVMATPSPATGAATPAPESSEWRAHGDEKSSLVFWHVGPALTPALRELQDRMIKALKKDPRRILKIEAESAQLSDAAKEQLRELLLKNSERTIIGLGVESAQMNLDLWREFAQTPELKSLRPGTAFMITTTRTVATLRFLPTHGLTHLETSSALKKETWAHLQSLALS